jgi:MFS-type transporter involved in bile tolerance (Atg22 family)
LTYPFRLVCYALGDLLQRYISDRYGWTLADATLIYSVQAVAAGLVLFTVLPFISGHIEHRFRYSIVQKNVVLSRAALLVMSVAYALIGLAPTALLTLVGLLIETLSTGFPATLRAIATALVGDDDRGRVFSVLAIAETLSIMMAYPVTAALFNIGIEKGGGPWLGLPYDIISVAAAVGFVGMCLVRFERPVQL